MTDAPASGKNVELSISRTAYGGDGIAVLGGKVVFVEGALPGERVLARLTADKKNFSRASVVEVLQASPFRIKPLCRYASHCGGCQYLHAEYAEELRLKELQLAEAFQALPEAAGKILPITPSAREYGYRNSVTMHAVFSEKKRGASMAYIAKDNVSKIPVKNCMIADPKLEPLFGREYPVKKGTDKVTFKLSETGAIVPDTEEIFFRVRLGGETFLVSSKGFFQNNLHVAGLLAAKAADWVRETAPDAFFDLYAGVGTFSVLSARGVPKIISVEESGASVQALRMNAEEKKIPGWRVSEGRTEKLFPQVWDAEKTPRSFVLLDPPRQGITPDLARYLAEKTPAAALAYVSCDPQTLARDLKIILSSGYWSIRSAAPFDMFPRTKHIETAVFMTPRAS